MIVVEGRVFLGGGLEKCCVGIENGRITAIKKILKGDERFDFGNSLVLPGCIDAHVHLREPGRTAKEDFYSGTLAAAFGGVTCVLDMPNNNPPVNSLENLKSKLDLVKGKANVDFGLYAALTKAADTGSLSKTATAFKVYMAESTDTGGISTGREDLEQVLSSAPAEIPISIHCEDERFMKKMEEKSLEDHLLARPDACEVQALESVYGIARKAKSRFHIAHVSSAEGIQFIEMNKKDLPITSEVTAHHMFLNVDNGPGAFGKVNPPLRRKRDNEALREALSRGAIDILVSDHAPHTMEEKEEGFARAPSGMPGVETGIPIMLNLVKKNITSLERFVKAASAAPAKIFGLNKGAIKVGSDGDLIVVDLKDVSKVRGHDLHSKCGWTPFENFEAIFPVATFVRGNLV
ncbi:MAG: dihydroorotase family protein, partial [Thermoplasmata archaeon]|nr:dihydroorotase family protein [Thermoplasmata archaeon]